MDRNLVMSRLVAAEQDLRSRGVARLSLFGSVARNDAGPASDIDLAAEFRRDQPFGMIEFAIVASHLEALLGSRVDLVGEPARNPRVQASIDRDRVNVF